MTNRSSSAKRVGSVPNWLKTRNWTGYLLLLILVIAVLLPTLNIVRGAFLSGLPMDPASVFTFDNFSRIYLSDGYIEALVNTLILAISVSIIVVIFGVVLSLITVRIEIFGHKAASMLLVAPLLVSPFVGAVAWVTLVQPNSGLLTGLLESVGLSWLNIFSAQGAIFVISVMLIPYAYLFISDAMRRVGADLYEAASIAGANNWKVLIRVVLPIVSPAIMSVFTLVFIMSSEMYTVPSLLAARDGFEVLPYLIYQNTAGYPMDYPAAATAGLALLVLAIIGLILYMRLNRRAGKFVTVTGKGARSLPLDKRVGPRIIGSIVIWGYIIVTTFLPILALLIRSLLPYFAADMNLSMLTLDNFENVLGNAQAKIAIMNSIQLAFISVVVALTVVTGLAFAIVRSKGFLSRALETLANIPMGVPGTVFAVGLVWTFIGTPVYGTKVIVFIAIFALWLPMTLRILQNAVAQNSKEFEEAADILGASTITKFLRISLPLLKTSLITAGALAFIMTFNEVSASAIVTTGKTLTLPVLLFDFMMDGEYGNATVLAVLQIGAVIFAVIMLMLIERLLGKKHSSGSALSGLVKR